ncbi:MAG: Holliday junction resolvase RuvX [Flammeovirgaceae bacterium]|nr:Holliday junction resolvase RuvX [Flammeovirgaceae bacterium]
MGRILAIDYGGKRVGLAVTDELKIIANALETIPQNEVLDYIKRYVAKENVEALVLGMPKNLNNTSTDATKMVEKFHLLLQKEFPNKEIHLVDERFTSKMAVSAMVTGGMKKKDRRKKENIDKISATIILQSFLEQRMF